MRCIGTSAFETWSIWGTQVKIVPILVVNDLEVVCDAAMDGLGIARLPSLVCRDAIESGHLRILFGPEPAQRSTVHAVYPSKQYLPAKVRIFVDALVALVKPMLPIEMADGHTKSQA
jgi:DNA-binding transcriptional LysR family regulator